MVEALATHRDERQMAENSLHNQHNIVNFLVNVSCANIDISCFNCLLARMSSWRKLCLALQMKI